MNLSETTFGDLRFLPAMPDELLYMKIPNSHSYNAVGPYGHIFYQKIETKLYTYWQSLYRPSQDLTIHAHRDDPWLGFRLLLKKHIRHFMDTGTEIYLQQGQFNYVASPVADSTFRLKKGNEYLVFDMYTKLSLLKNLKLKVKVLHNFLERADTGMTELLVKGSAWGNIALLDAVTHFFKYPFDESVANSVVKLAVQAAASDQQRISLLEDRVESLFAVQQSIKENIRQHINIQALAQKAGMNEQYFKNGFKQVLGITPFDYLEFERLKAAKLLLKESQWGMQAIAAQVGYNDPSSFIRMFSRMEGIPPNEWRKRTV